jgi:hypothetical protein
MERSFTIVWMDVEGKPFSAFGGFSTFDNAEVYAQKMLRKSKGENGETYSVVESFRVGDLAYRQDYLASIL